MMPKILPRLLHLPPAWVTWNESRSCPFTKWESSSGRNSNSATHLIRCCLQLSTRLKALAHSFAPRVSTPIDQGLLCHSFQGRGQSRHFHGGEANAWTYPPLPVPCCQSRSRSADSELYRLSSSSIREIVPNLNSTRSNRVS